jgi:hypothetical protein
MPTLITKENKKLWLSDKSEAYVDGWTCCEDGNEHLDFDGSMNNFSEAEYSEYTEGYSQCFSNQACIDSR